MPGQGWYFRLKTLNKPLQQHLQHLRLTPVLDQSSAPLVQMGRASRGSSNQRTMRNKDNKVMPLSKDDSFACAKGPSDRPAPRSRSKSAPVAGTRTRSW